MRISTSVLAAKHCQHRFAWVLVFQSSGFQKRAGGWPGLSSEQSQEYVDSVISWSPSVWVRWKGFAFSPNFCVLSFAAALNIHVGQIRFCFYFLFLGFLVFCFSCALYQNIINKFACRATAFFITSHRCFWLAHSWPLTFLIKCTCGLIF